MILAFGLFQNSQGCRMQGPQLLPQPPPMYADTPTCAPTCTHCHPVWPGSLVWLPPSLPSRKGIAEEKQAEPKRSGPCGSQMVFAQDRGVEGTGLLGAA